MLKPVRNNVSVETLKYNINVCQQELNILRQTIKDAQRTIRKANKEGLKVYKKQKHYKELLGVKSKYKSKLKYLPFYF